MIEYVLCIRDVVTQSYIKQSHGLETIASKEPTKQVSRIFYD
jgi:hypothetical protein